jgi:hypothetical protein
VKFVQCYTVATVPAGIRSVLSSPTCTVLSIERMPAGVQDFFEFDHRAGLLPLQHDLMFDDV